MKTILATVMIVLVSAYAAIGLAHAANSAERTGAHIDDSVITAKIKSALVADRTVDGFDIRVETHQGDVVMSGTVESQAQSDRAARIAQQVDGVRKVDNRMRVKR